MIRRQRPIDPLLDPAAGTSHGDNPPPELAPLVRIVADPGPATQPFLDPPPRTRKPRGERRVRVFSGPLSPVTRRGRKGWLR
jgi:hypothetical protein